MDVEVDLHADDFFCSREDLHMQDCCSPMHQEACRITSPACMTLAFASFEKCDLRQVRQALALELVIITQCCNEACRTDLQEYWHP